MIQVGCIAITVVRIFRGSNCIQNKLPFCNFISSSERNDASNDININITRGSGMVAIFSLLTSTVKNKLRTVAE